MIKIKIYDDGEKSVSVSYFYESGSFWWEEIDNKTGIASKSSNHFNVITSVKELKNELSMRYSQEWANKHLTENIKNCLKENIKRANGPDPVFLVFIKSLAN